MPIYFDWTVELNETTSSRGTPDFGPNPALDAGDFVPVDVLIPTNQSKTYSITHVPGGGDESIPMTGKVSILPTPGQGASHNPDYTYLQYVDPSDGSLVQVDGDQVVLL